MSEEAGRAAEALEPGSTVDVYPWTRDLAMRIAMRALFGFDPESGRASELAATLRERAGLPRPRVPDADPGRARYALRRGSNATGGGSSGSSATRSPAGGRGDEDGDDILGSLVAVTDEEGRALATGRSSTTSSRCSSPGTTRRPRRCRSSLYELARDPGWAERLARERDVVCGDREPTPEELFGELPLLTRAVDETLRLYPPAWIGPRRSVRDFEHAGVRVPAGLPCRYSSWVSHRLPDVFEDPDRFDPDRFEPERRARLPRGAYVPFGMGPRVCIGKRFGYTEVHAIAAALLRRFTLELPGGFEPEMRQAPTLSVAELPVRLPAR